MSEDELVTALRRTAAGMEVRPPPTDRIVAAGRRRARRLRTAQVVASVAAAFAVLVPVGVATRATVPAAVEGCPAAVAPAVLPEWARTGFTDPEPVMPFVLGARGGIAAVLFGDPLSAPPSPSRANKILWVARADPAPGPLTITARRDPAAPPVVIEVPGGPGPSIVDLPAPGCWQLDLRWPGGADALSLRYTPPQPQ
jgi:hypothetical protein